jgi:hypothetical protein
VGEQYLPPDILYRHELSSSLKNALETGRALEAGKSFVSWCGFRKGRGLEAGGTYGS